ncbi:hypothetical protein HAHE_40830 [Haloferula helveola]|uniref:Uncharacterized protein n=1 Tax=Haloferula helveola TaxID=490095 RepID=A0ABN6H965_9BACT|nr:hypothetical protein HAHE_40830 [Haloferula helveola]
MNPLPGPAGDSYSDRDLAEALRPLVGTGATSPGPFGSLEEFESALRSAFRRTFAQYTGSPFDPPDILRRALWRFDALVSSRSYEETLDRKIRRFRIEEVHLLDKSTLELISFASVKPSRHSDPRKVRPTVSQLATELTDQPDRTQFRFDKSLHASVRHGELTILVALVRGRPDPLAEPDLDYAHRRIEKTFHEPLLHGDPLLQEIQPLLEECLLIHSPVSPIPN